jgi:hypothetical protein
MTDQVDTQGVPVDNDSNLADPGDNTNAPDGLIGEKPQTTGALGAVIGSTNDKQSRVASARESMDELKQQYAMASKSAESGFEKQKELLDAATQRLVGMQAGPTDRETALRMFASMGQGNTGGMAARALGVKADAMQAQREAEMQKQGLISQYGLQGTQAQIGAASAMQNRLIQQMRLNQSELNNSTTQADKNSLVNKYYTPDPNNPGKFIYHPEMAQADEQLAVQKAKDIATAKLAAQASAQGMITPEAVEYTQRTGKAPSGFSRNPVINSQLWQAVHQKNLAEGNQASDWYAQTQMNQAQVGVLKDFTSGGTSKELGSFNTAVGHINTLKPLIDQLNNGNVAVFNNIGNWWNQNILGKPAPTDFKGVRSFVAGEISKAVLPGGGGEQERLELANQASSANSGPALHSILERWQELLASKANAMRNKWDIGTQGQHGSFDQFLLPATKTALGIGDSPERTPASGRPPVQPPHQQAPNPLVSKWLQPQ